MPGFFIFKAYLQSVEASLLRVILHNSSKVFFGNRHDLSLHNRSIWPLPVTQFVVRKRLLQIIQSFPVI